MSVHRIYAIFIRHLFLLRRVLDKSLGTLTAPIVDLLVWGMTSTYVDTFAGAQGGVRFASLVIGGILLWHVLNTVQGDININILEELWNRNLVNIIGTPLRFSEWISSIVLLSLFKTSITTSIAALFAFILYKTNLFSGGFLLLPFFVLLLLNGMWLAFIISGLVLRRGTSMQALAWTLAFILAPFSGIYYPVTLLPHGMQLISSLVPTSYIFAGFREIVQYNRLDTHSLFLGTLLTLVYLVFALAFFYRSYKVRLQKGVLALI